MRAFIIGIGEVGQHIARTLVREGHDVVVIDRDERRVDAMAGELDALVLHGNGGSPRFLREAGAGEADLLLAVTEADETNVIAALAAHQLGAGRTVARLRDTDYFGAEGAFSRDVLGIDFVIYPERATAEDLADAVLLPGAVQVQYFADGLVAVAEVILTERSALNKVPVREHAMIRPHAVFGVARNNRVRAVDLDETLGVGDHVLVAASRENIGPTVAHLAGHAEKVRHAIIFGGGRIGLPLARRLEEVRDLQVTVMERDPERAREVAEQLRRATVLHEEGVSKDALMAHGVHKAGAFVACAGDDRANLLAALHAKQVGAGLCLSVVSREEFTPLIGALGIDGGFSPRLVTAEAILRFLRGEHVSAMHVMLGGAEVIEVQAEPGCEAEDRSVRHASLAARSPVAALVRDGSVHIPKDTDRIERGDRLVVLNVRRANKELKRAFAAA